MKRTAIEETKAAVKPQMLQGATGAVHVSTGQTKGAQQ